MWMILQWFASPIIDLDSPPRYSALPLSSRLAVSLSFKTRYKVFRHEQVCLSGADSGTRHNTIEFVDMVCNHSPDKLCIDLVLEFISSSIASLCDRLTHAIQEVDWRAPDRCWQINGVRPTISGIMTPSHTLYILKHKAYNAPAYKWRLAFVAV